MNKLPIMAIVLAVEAIVFLVLFTIFCPEPKTDHWSFSFLFVGNISASVSAALFVLYYGRK